MLLPVCIILILDIVILVVVMRTIYKSSTSNLRRELNKDSSQMDLIMGQAKVAFSCSVLLGITWLFGVLAVGDARDAFQYLFTIFNSLQGFFIFLLYTVRSPEVRKEWRRLLRKDGKKIVFESHICSEGSLLIDFVVV